MKIAFSTLGCPNYDWKDVYSIAKDLGFDGIEVREIRNEFKRSPFSVENCDKTAQKLKQIKLEVPCLSTGCVLSEIENSEENIKEISEYIEVASKLGSKYIRILADRNPQPVGEIDDEIIISEINKLIPLAKDKNIILLIETNGVYADTLRLKKLLDKINDENVAALWDTHHPYRFFNEVPLKTVENLGSYIKYTHFKDSIIKDGVLSYKMMGEGDMPVEEIMMALKSMSFDGYLTLEWVKRWAPELTDAGIVFPQYAEYMRPYKRNHKHPLQDNNRKTGKYIWPKERLIEYTFADILDRVCEEFPNQLAFKYTELDYERTYPEFRDDVDNFARALLAMGVKKGDHIAIWATNVPQWYITFWAATKIGCVLVTVNTAYKIHEAEYLLKQSDTHTLVMIDGYKDSDYVGIIKELCPELKTSKPGRLDSKKFPYLKNIITINAKIDGCYTWEEAMEKSSEVPYEEVERLRKTVDKHDVANMQYTSGTTGFPKGVMLTHYNVINNGKAIGDCMDLSTADRMMIQVPMFHCFGMVLAMTASITHGTSMFPITAFSPRKGLKCINQERITCFHGVPTMFIAMLGHEDFEKTDFSHMRTGIMAGSPCPIKTMQEVIEKMHMPEICITYGQTEASPATTMSKTTDSIDLRVNTVGAPIFGVECKIVDPETNEELPDNVDGEFVARGYNIMKGYYKMPEATAAAIDDEGWLHSGDLARRTPEGYFKITGRIKDMIIRGGENIYPKEIEDFLYTHPKIKDVQVIGVPDKDYGEEIMACIILKEGETSSEEEMKQYVLDHMAKHKVPRYIDFVTEFPMNAAGKILKYKMREQAVEKLNLQNASKIVTA